MLSGYKNKVEVKDIPKGTSIVAREFSPGKPQPTIIEAIMQQTIDITKESLEFDEPDKEEPGEGEEEEEEEGEKEDSEQDLESEQSAAAGENIEIENSSDAPKESAEETAMRKAKEQAEAEELARSIAEQLHMEIIDGQIELLAKGAFVVIRIREKGSFASASDTIEAEFIPVINKIETILGDTKGEIRVAGHTDNLPIDNEYFRSNWELSGGRAGSVTRELLKNGFLDRNRFVITGYADTKPIADNSTSEGRATNRRVEIIIVQGDQPEGEVVGVSMDSE